MFKYVQNESRNQYIHTCLNMYKMKVEIRHGGLQ